MTQIVKQVELPRRKHKYVLFKKEEQCVFLKLRFDEKTLQPGQVVSKPHMLRTHVHCQHKELS